MIKTIDLKIRLLCDDEVAMGPGKAALLEAIVDAGSISAAARNMKMSYRRAWMLVDVMNRSFKEPLVHSVAGGRQGGGASVTDAGRHVLAQYRALEQAALTAAQGRLTTLVMLLADPAEIDPKNRHG